MRRRSVSTDTVPVDGERWDGTAGAAPRVAALWRWVRSGAAVFCLVQFATYVPGEGVEVPWPLPAVGVAVAGFIVLVNIGAVWLERHRPRCTAPEEVARRDLVLLAADTFVIVVVVQVFAFEPTSAVWVLLVVPVLEAGLVGRLRWALTVCGVAVAALGLREVLAVQLHDLPPPDLPVLLSVEGFRIGVLLLVATAVGVQASVAHQYLRQLREAQVALAHEAGHDHLTGLVTRRLFLERAGASLRRHRAEEGGVAILFVDCDSFKAVNDRLGHAAGDEVLQQVADRLRALAGPEDTVARLGGDEFAVLLHSQGTRRVDAATVRSALTEPYTVSEHGSVPMSCSVGAATHRQGETLPDLLRRADQAMYADKASRAAGRAAGPGVPDRTG